MKVHELIAALQLMPHDADVQAEGCDCIGDCDKAVMQDDGAVLLLRPDEDAPYWRREEPPRSPPTPGDRARWAKEIEAERSQADAEPTDAEVEVFLRVIQARR